MYWLTAANLHADIVYDYLTYIAALRLTHSKFCHILGHARVFSSKWHCYGACLALYIWWKKSKLIDAGYDLAGLWMCW